VPGARLRGGGGGSGGGAPAGSIAKTNNPTPSELPRFSVTVAPANVPDAIIYANPEWPPFPIKVVEPKEVLKLLMLPWHVPPAMRTMAFALVVLSVTEKYIAVVPPYAGNVLFGSKGALLFAPARVTTATSTSAAPGTFTVMLYVPALAATAYATNTQLLRHPFPTLTLYLVVHDKEGLDETEGLGVPAISTSAITTSNSLEP